MGQVRHGLDRPKVRLVGIRESPGAPRCTGGARTAFHAFFPSVLHSPRPDDPACHLSPARLSRYRPGERPRHDCRVAHRTGDRDLPQRYSIPVHDAHGGRRVRRPAGDDADGHVCAGPTAGASGAQALATISPPATLPVRARHRGRPGRCSAHCLLRRAGSQVDAGKPHRQPLEPGSGGLRNAVGTSGVVETGERRPSRVGVLGGDVLPALGGCRMVRGGVVQAEAAGSKTFHAPPDPPLRARPI